MVLNCSLFNTTSNDHTNCRFTKTLSYKNDDLIQYEPILYVGKTFSYKNITQTKPFLTKNIIQYEPILYVGDMCYVFSLYIIGC
jgi:hypothetical protein